MPAPMRSSHRVSRPAVMFQYDVAQRPPSIRRRTGGSHSRRSGGGNRRRGRRRECLRAASAAVLDVPGGDRGIRPIDTKETSCRARRRHRDVEMLRWILARRPAPHIEELDAAECGAMPAPPLQDHAPEKAISSCGSRASWTSRDIMLRRRRRACPAIARRRRAMRVPVSVGSRACNPLQP